MKPAHIAAAFLLASGPSLAAPWPAQTKATYVERCTENSVASGYMEYWSRKYCACLAGGMEKEFSADEHESMRAAQPSATGSAYDKRLYVVFESCKDSFPKKKHRPGSPLQ